MFKVEASAPSNIALIKYMGKREGQNSNQPTNASLSFTLDNLRTTVRLSEVDEASDRFEPLDQSLRVSENGVRRFLKHFELLKSNLNFAGSYLIQSSNNFPSDCGLASSASSFAALTLAAGMMAQKKNSGEPAPLKRLSELSRQGSGSSCRSLFGPFAVWKTSFAEPLSMNFSDLQHLAVLASEEHKSVSSSEAHVRVTTSLLFAGRPQRAEERLAALIAADRAKDWKAMFEIVWAEFWDMHALFETSAPSFGYMDAASLDILNFCRRYWIENQDGPLVTMDAGPNVHLLFRRDQSSVKEHFARALSAQHRIWTSSGEVR